MKTTDRGTVEMTVEERQEFVKQLRKDAAKERIDSWFDDVIEVLERELQEARRNKASFTEYDADPEDRLCKPEDLMSSTVHRLLQMVASCRLDLVAKNAIDYREAQK